MKHNGRKQLVRFSDLVVGAQLDRMANKLGQGLLPRELDRHGGIGQFPVEPGGVSIVRQHDRHSGADLPIASRVRIVKVNPA